MKEPFSVADLLAKSNPGDEHSMTTLMPLVYGELRRLASGYLDRHGDAGGRAHTLQPTALVHEAFLKMVGNDRHWSGRDHFMAVAAKAMRQVLVDHARRKSAVKRGGHHDDPPPDSDSASGTSNTSARATARPPARLDISIDDIAAAGGSGSREMRVCELDDLLTELAKSDARAAQAAEMRFFGGMDQEQIARVQGISRTIVASDWQFARAWLASKVIGDRRG